MLTMQRRARSGNCIGFDEEDEEKSDDNKHEDDESDDDDDGIGYTHAQNLQDLMLDLRPDEDEHVPGIVLVSTLTRFTAEQWADHVKNTLEFPYKVVAKGSPAKLLGFFHRLYHTFTLDGDGDNRHRMRKLETRYGVLTQTPAENRGKIHDIVSFLRSELRGHDLLDTQTTEGRVIHQKLSILVSGFSIILKYLGLASDVENPQMLTGDELQEMGEDEQVKDTSVLDQVRYFLDRMSQENLRLKRPADYTAMKSKTSELMLYRPCEASGNYYFEPFKTLENYCWDAQKEWYTISQRKSLWARSDRGRMNVMQVLAKGNSAKLPALKPNRYIHAFQNGLFVVLWGRFFPFQRTRGYKGKLAKDLTGNLVAYKFHDQVYRWWEIEQDMQEHEDETGNWTPLGVKLPYLNRIFDTQKFTTMTKVFALCFLGRVLFEQNLREQWHVAPAFIGLGGTGKSILLKLVEQFFETEDVAYLNNQVQRQFALAGILGRKLWLAMDINQNWTFDQTDFYTLVSGEGTNVQRKHRDPKAVKSLGAQGMIASNTHLPFRNDGNAAVRRVVTFLFKFFPAERDNSLWTNLIKDLDRVLFVIVNVYLQISREFGTKDIKKHLSEQLKVWESETKREMSLLESFVFYKCEVTQNVEGNRRGASKRARQNIPYATLREFRTEYQSYRTAHGSRMQKIDDTTIATMCQEHKIRFYSGRPDDQGPLAATVTEAYFTGITVKHHEAM